MDPDYGFNVAVLVATAFIWLLFAVVGYVLFAWFLMKIFEKAGVTGKWRAWVPVYNAMIFLKLGDLNPWLILIAIGGSVVLGWIPVIGQLIALAAFLLTMLAAWRVGLKLQKEVPWLILYFFLSIVWYGILAFDKSRWNPNIAPAPWAGNGFLSDRTVWEGVPAQPSGAPAPGGAAQGYAQPAAPGYAPPTQPYMPPATPSVPPAQAAPPAPPADPTDPNRPPAQ